MSFLGLDIDIGKALKRMLTPGKEGLEMVRQWGQVAEEGQALAPIALGLASGGLAGAVGGWGGGAMGALGATEGAFGAQWKGGAEGALYAMSGMVPSAGNPFLSSSAPMAGMDMPYSPSYLGEPVDDDGVSATPKWVLPVTLIGVGTVIGLVALSRRR